MSFSRPGRLPRQDASITHQGEAVNAKRRSAGHGIFLLLISGAGILLTLAHRLDADEGQILTAAWNLFHGLRIYEDFFEFIGPGSSAWVSLFFRVLSPTYGTALLASQILLLVSLWAFYASSRRVIGHGVAGGAVSILWLLAATTPPFINHNSHSSFLATVFALTMLRLLQGGHRGHAAMAGALAALTFFVLQPKGLALLGVGLLVLLARSYRARARTTGDQVPGSPLPAREKTGKETASDPSWPSLLAFLAGAMGVGTIGLLLWGPHPVLVLVTVGRGTLAMNHLSLSYLPLVGFLGVAVLVTLASYREGLMDDEGRFLLLLQAGLWASSAHLPDAWHLWINSFPLLLMIGRLGARSVSRPMSLRWRVGMAVLFGLVVLAGTGRAAVQNLMETRATRVWLSELRKLLGDEEFFAFTFLPSFYLDLQVENPYFNSVLYVGNHPVEHFERNVAILSERQPRFVLLDYGSVEKYGHSLENPVDEFIRREYSRAWELVHSQGTLEVWEKS